MSPDDSRDGGWGAAVNDREALLGELRPTSFAIAYRMLGSVSEAEDVVQEALLRVHQSLDAGEEITSPRAFVATVTTRLAINELRSARARREHYVGEWLPEPIITEGADDPAVHAETADSLSLAMLVLLESLSPEQRAVLLLHDVFGYGYPEITGDRRQERGQRAPARDSRPPAVKARRPRFTTTREHQHELAQRFFAAAEHGDLTGLEALLAHDVELTGDGGGKVPALAKSLLGRSRVARTVMKWLQRSRSTRGCRCVPSRSTVALERSSLTRANVCWLCGRSTSSTARSPPSARSSTPTSSPTLARSAMPGRSYVVPADASRNPSAARSGKEGGVRMCCRRGTRLAADRRVFAAITDVSGFAHPGRRRQREHRSPQPMNVRICRSAVRELTA